MTPSTASKIHHVMHEMAVALNDVTARHGEQAAHGPLGVAVVTVLNRVDQLLAALPLADGDRSAVARHPTLAGVDEPKGCPVPLRLPREEAEALCARVLPMMAGSEPKRR